MSSYFDVQALSASGLNKYIDEGPHYYWPISPFNPNRVPSLPPTDDMIFGTACHKLLFERDDFLEEFHIVSCSDRRTTRGKQEVSEAQQEYPEKFIIGQDTYNHVVTCIDAIWRNSDIKRLLTGAIFEEEIYWVREGLPCKGKLDATKHNTILDYKATKSAKEQDFTRAITERGYHRQDFWYRDGKYRLTGEIHQFGFIVQDKTNPDAIGLFTIPEQLRMRAKEEAERAASEILDRILNNKWNQFKELPYWQRIRPEGVLNV